MTLEPTEAHTTTSYFISRVDKTNFKSETMEEIFEIETTPRFDYYDSQNDLVEKEALTSAKTQCYFSENSNITEFFNFGNHGTDVDQYISIPCSSTGRTTKFTGIKLFVCRSDGKFHYVNSTCINKSIWIKNYENEVKIMKMKFLFVRKKIFQFVYFKLKNKTNALKIIENISIDLKSNDKKNDLFEMKSIDTVVNLIKNISHNIQQENQNAKNVFMNTQFCFLI